MKTRTLKILSAALLVAVFVTMMTIAASATSLVESAPADPLPPAFATGEVKVICLAQGTYCPLCPAQVSDQLLGTRFIVNLPEIEGYTPVSGFGWCRTGNTSCEFDTAMTRVACQMPADDGGDGMRVVIMFEPAPVEPIPLYTLTVQNYLNGVYEDSTEYQFAAGEEYEIPVEDRTGYKPDQEVITGIMPEGDLEVIVQYELQTYNVFIDYYYPGEEEASMGVAYPIHYGAHYFISIPHRVGRCVTDKESVSGIMPAEDVHVRVNLTLIEDEPIPGPGPGPVPVPTAHTVTVLLYQIPNAPEDFFDKITFSAVEGEEFTFEAPAYAGMKACETELTGVMGEEDITLSIAYVVLDLDGPGEFQPVDPGEFQPEEPIIW